MPEKMPNQSRLTEGDNDLEKLCQETADVSRGIAALCWQIQNIRIISSQDLQNYLWQINQWDKRLSIVEEALLSQRTAIAGKQLLMPKDRQALSRLDIEAASLHHLSQQLSDLFDEVMAWDSDNPPLQV